MDYIRQQRTMFPPSQGLSLDIDAISGICGFAPFQFPQLSQATDCDIEQRRSISVACWVVVFSPQIIENFTRGSADGLSLVFLIVWLAGDVFNILGAVLQGVLPTMVGFLPLLPGYFKGEGVVGGEVLKLD